MSINPRPGDFRFFGFPRLFYIAICRRCEMAMPFNSPIDRIEWVKGHLLALEHDVRDFEYAIDVRPDARELSGIPIDVADPPDWSPFGHDGKLDESRLATEGWHHVGFINDEGL